MQTPRSAGISPLAGGPARPHSAGHALSRIGLGYPFGSLKERSSFSPLFFQGVAGCLA